MLLIVRYAESPWKIDCSSGQQRGKASLLTDCLHFICLESLSRRCRERGDKQSLLEQVIELTGGLYKLIEDHNRSLEDSGRSWNAMETGRIFGPSDDF